MPRGFGQALETHQTKALLAAIITALGGGFWWLSNPLIAVREDASSVAEAVIETNERVGVMAEHVGEIRTAQVVQQAILERMERDWRDRAQRVDARLDDIEARLRDAERRAGGDR